MPIALVTGAGGRLGEVIARHLARNGYQVIVHVNKSRAQGNKLTREIVREGNKAVLASCDFSRPASVTKFFDKIAGQHGVPDLIVNNASTFDYDFPGKASETILNRSLAIHVSVPFLLLELAFKAASRRHPITVVNILDQKVINLNPDYFSYTLSKAALQAATVMLAQSLAPQVRVCGVAPGVTMVSGPMTDDEFAKARTLTPLQRSSTPQDIARAVRFLIESPAITGTTLMVDGGQHLQAQARDVLFIANPTKEH